MGPATATAQSVSQSHFVFRMRRQWRIEKSGVALRSCHVLKDESGGKKNLHMPLQEAAVKTRIDSFATKFIGRASAARAWALRAWAKSPTSKDADESGRLPLTRPGRMEGFD